MSGWRVRAVIALSAAIALCGAEIDLAFAQTATSLVPDKAALESIDPVTLLAHVKTLASDEFEGRAPGTRGETLTVAYLVDAFKRLGVEPGNPDGTYVQDVPLIGFTSEVRAFLSIGDRRVEWDKREFVASSFVARPTVEVNDSELVFVGYGVIAPEYGWDDYKDVDVRGKTVVFLMNDPQVPDPRDPTRYDDTMFKGIAKTWYSTGRHKRQVAAARGAAASITVHEAIHAGWPFSVAQSSFGREELMLRDDVEPRLSVDAIVPVDKVKEWFAAAGKDFDALRKLAVRRDFTPVVLDAKASFTLTNKMRSVTSHNVVARVRGSDSERRDDTVIVTAHWDHLGLDPSLKGDPVYHGALDNASGVATLLEVAKAWSRLAVRPARSVLFMATTAEESGLLGARHYAAHPLYPLGRTVADLNLDIVNMWGNTRDLQIVGLGDSTLDRTLQEVARTEDKTLTPDMSPSLGQPFRQDALEFNRAGVPSVYVRGGDDYFGKPRSYALGRASQYAKDYHSVTDTVHRDWNLAGAVDIGRFVLAAAYRLAQDRAFPEWLPGAEFRSKLRGATAAGQAEAAAGAATR